MDPPASSPLVSICLSVFNGERWLAQTLESLLAQDHRALELIILDNQSTDGTPELCRRFACFDPRLRLIIDDARRSVTEGQRKAFGYARGDYYMLACDDDVYDPWYVSSLVAALQAAPEAGLAYAGFGIIDEQGTCTPAQMNPAYFRTADRRPAGNFAFFMLRTPNVPMIFGLMKRPLAAEAFPYYSEIGPGMGFHDTLFMLRLLSLARVTSVPRMLFHYRQKDRREAPPIVPPEYRRSLWTRHLFASRCRLRLRSHVGRLINDAPFSRREKWSLHAWNLITTGFFVVGGHLAFVTLRKRFPRLLGGWGQLRGTMFDEKRA